MRTILMGMALAGASLSAVADFNVIGFWDFKGGTTGDDAGTVTASMGQWTGTAYKANASGNKGTLPTYSDACPSVKIFTDASHREVLVSNPKSLHFSLAGENFALGTRADQRATYAFRGKVSCLRIMPKALGIDEFMTATDRLPGLVVIVR